MQLKHFFYTAIFLLGTLHAAAQQDIPSGYTKGTVTLADGTVTTGYIKDNLKKSAAVAFIDNAGKKKNYDGMDINGVTIDGVSFICIKGDFFKTISTGKLNFLQKASNAAGKASFNGTDAVFNSGTEGKIGDYFVYSNQQLKLINKKNVDAFINTDLSGCTAAIEKAKTANGDIAKLQEAVDIYNHAN